MDIDGAFPNLTEALLQATVNPDAWEDVQDLSERYLGAFASQIASVDHAHGNAFFSRTPKCPELDFVLDDIAPHSEPVAFAAHNPHWRRFTDYDYIDEQGIAKSEFYARNHEFDIGYRLGLRLIDEPHSSKAIVWFWRKADGHVQDSELKRLDRIQAMLRRTAAIYERFGSGLELSGDVLQTVEGIGQAALVVDSKLRVVAENEIADRLICGNDGIALDRDRRIALWHQSSQRRLDKLAGGIEAFIQSGNGDLIVERPSGRLPYFLSLVPLSLRQSLFGRPPSLALVLIRDPLTTRFNCEAALRDHFQLTDAELSVLAHFSDGLSLREISNLRGVSLNTVRVQFTSIMTKLNVSRQTDLMKCLSIYSR